MGGYDNPGFDSPVDYFKKLSGPRLSSMEWSDSPAIGSGYPVICEGSSTPRVRNGDSAFLEPSSAVKNHLLMTTITYLWTRMTSSTSLLASTRTRRGLSAASE